MVINHMLYPIEPRVKHRAAGESCCRSNSVAACNCPYCSGQATAYKDLIYLHDAVVLNNPGNIKQILTGLREGGFSLYSRKIRSFVA